MQFENGKITFDCKDWIKEVFAASSRVYELVVSDGWKLLGVKRLCQALVNNS